jgi:large subunit ribosomal protein L13
MKIYFVNRKKKRIFAVLTLKSVGNKPFFHLNFFNQLDTLSYKTVSANQATVVKQWYVIDANTEIVGRLATEAARILRGKHKPSYTPHVDCGDNVIIINADKVRFTGNKMNVKEYAFYSGHPGGRRLELAKTIIRRRPTYIVEKAIKGMLPKNRLGAHIFTNLYVYQGSDHPHTAQQPVKIEIKK